MPSNITERIAVETGIPRLFPALAEEIPLSDLQSLLLSVYQERARSVSESAILARFRKNPLLAPSSVDARSLNAFDRIACDAAHNFEVLDLSPVCPLATNFVLGGIDQNNVLTTIRNVEVLGDSTPVLALECARRRKDAGGRASSPPVCLAASQRVVRMQPFDFDGFTPHFRLFTLVSAGRDIGSAAFEIRHLTEHLRFYLTMFRALNQAGYSLTRPRVEISDLTMTEALVIAGGSSRAEVREAVRAHLVGGSERFLAGRGIALPTPVADPKEELAEVAQRHGLEKQAARLALLKERVTDPLKAEFPEAGFLFDLSRLEGLGYYTGLCLRVSPQAPDGVHYPVADGGFTDWTARLLQDHKERLLTSGIGSEFVCKRYRSDAPER